MAKRRGNNEGSIYRRKDGYWVGQYGVQTAEGDKPRRVSPERPTSLVLRLLLPYCCQARARAPETFSAERMLLIAVGANSTEILTSGVEFIGNSSASVLIKRL